MDGTPNSLARIPTPPARTETEYAIESVTAPTEGEVDITFMVACYNEQGNITPTLEQLTAAIDEVGCSAEILVIDDASTDGTCDEVRAFQAAHPEQPVVLFTNAVNRGLAQNFIEGAFLARGRYYRLVCGDNAEPKESFVTVLRNLDVADLVLFYPVKVYGRPLHRKVLSRAYTMLINGISGNSVRYYNGCPLFRRYHVMRWHTNYRGFGFQADMVTRLLSQGVHCVQVPTDCSTDRSQGDSKALTLKNSLSVAHTVFDISVRRVGRLTHRWL